MLGVRTYTREYVDSCRARVDSGTGAYRKLVTKVPSTGKGAVEAFEAAYFTSMIIVLDAMFVHRLRGIEGKDGNPLNEVRVIANALLEHGGVMTADKTIKMSADKTVLKIAYGEAIREGEADFGRISAALFGEMRASSCRGLSPDPSPSADGEGSEPYCCSAGVVGCRSLPGCC